MKKGRRTPSRRITPTAIDLFDSMQALEQRCSCDASSSDQCDACKEWWEQNHKLHRELKLRPWQWPAYGNYADTNKTGAFERYQALTAASNARK
jgi:hypothetical protein